MEASQSAYNFEPLSIQLPEYIVQSWATIGPPDSIQSQAYISNIRPFTAYQQGIQFMACKAHNLWPARYTINCQKGIQFMASKAYNLWSARHTISSPTGVHYRHFNSVLLVIGRDLYPSTCTKCIRLKRFLGMLEAHFAID